MLDQLPDWRGLVQGLALLLLAPGLLGLLRWAKARAQGRRRVLLALLQPYRDLSRLMGQPSVRAGTSSWVFAVVPIILMTCYGTLAFAVPLFGQPPLLRIDLIAFVYLLGLARFALALAGLDAGAPFGGLGSSRSMFLNVPTELALVLIGATLALRWHTLSVWSLVGFQCNLGWRYFLEADLVLVAFALATAISLETGRIPIDNPATHLELTMSQKAVTLEYAGRDLALVEWAEAIKLGVLLSLFVSLFVMPLTSGFTAGRPSVAVVSVAVLILAVVLVARSEVGRPKLRLRKVVGPAVLSVGLSLSAILYFVIVHWGASK